MIRAAQVRAARKRYREMAPVLNEQSRRRFVALGAQALRRGGVSLIAGSADWRGRRFIMGSAPPGRVRRRGGGRKKKSSRDPTLVVSLKSLVEPVTRGDPMQPLLWTTRSLRNLVDELAKKGHSVCPTVVGDLLRGMGYSLQANSKTREGDKHIDRDAQFQYINTQAAPRWIKTNIPKASRSPTLSWAPSAFPATRSTATGTTRSHQLEKVTVKGKLSELFMDGP
jgi:Rhodopirellula transposase DDE domain